MPTKLQLYNQALLHLRESTLVDLNEARESRRNLDVVYDDVLKLMLEAGFWKFAMRSIQITADTSITPAFGPSFAFDKPTDWVKTYFVSASETFDPPLDGWLEESNLFFADINPIPAMGSTSIAGPHASLKPWCLNSPGASAPRPRGPVTAWRPRSRRTRFWPCPRH
jgi:hypothetical protein